MSIFFVFYETTFTMVSKRPECNVSATLIITSNTHVQYGIYMQKFICRLRLRISGLYQEGMFSIQMMPQSTRKRHHHQLFVELSLVNSRRYCYLYANSSWPKEVRNCQRRRCRASHMVGCCKVIIWASLEEIFKAYRGTSARYKYS
jgi:hypothetical protein